MGEAAQRRMELKLGLLGDAVQDALNAGATPDDIRQAAENSIGAWEAEG